MNKRSYVLGVLVALSTLNQLDRQLMAILLEPIRREFALSDVQLGLLSGLAFAAIYAALSISAALWAVNHSRRNLIAMAAAVWGTTTVLFGAAQSYWHLLLTRIGTGAGEAGAMPASHSIISDLYEPHERAGAMSAWSAGINVGIFVAFLVGGYIGHRYGWRAAFAAAGILTLAVALLARLTIAEPMRSADVRSAALRTAPSTTVLREAVIALWSDGVMRHVIIGATITAAVGYGTLTWAPSYLVRTHGMTLPMVGAYLATVIGIGGAIGAFFGGRLCDRLRRRDIRWSLWVVGIAFIASKPLIMIFYLSSDTVIALSAFVPAALVSTLYLGPSLSVLHNRISAPLRPAVSAIFLMLLNLVGLSIGPLLVGMMSGWLFNGTANSLGYSLAALHIVGLWGGLHFIAAGKRLAGASKSVG
jgi:predicted MFS family arabinose efflux permease